MNNIYLGRPNQKVENWCKKKKDTGPLCFTATEVNSKIELGIYGRIIPSGATLSVHLQYSTDNMQTWTQSDWDGSPITLANVGDKVYIRANLDNTDGFGNPNNLFYHTFKITNKVVASGNIQYLLSQNGERLDVPPYCYHRLFTYCSGLLRAPALPATTLTDSCYYDMFSGCTSLISAPVLPATTLADSCYSDMFQNCTSLTQAPTLPATTLASSCYQLMFYGCTSLTSAPVLPATTLANRCYYWMFNNCTSLTQAPTLPATTLTDSCYSDMFADCTSLVQAPVLSATELAVQCYSSMFSGCTKFSECHMKSSMKYPANPNGYQESIHGDTTKIVIYDP